MNCLAASPHPFVFTPRSLVASGLAAASSVGATRCLASIPGDFVDDNLYPYAPSPAPRILSASKLEPSLEYFASSLHFGLVWLLEYCPNSVRRVPSTPRLFCGTSESSDVGSAHHSPSHQRRTILLLNTTLATSSCRLSDSIPIAPITPIVLHCHAAATDTFSRLLEPFWTLRLMY